MHEAEERKSKSRKKRESTALQRLGEDLAALDAGSIDALGLPDDLREALAEARAMKSHEARRRHMQYIGRLMRSIEAEPLMAAMEDLKASRRRDARRFERIEAWRDRLVAGDEDVLEEILAALPDADRQQLRQLARVAARETAEGRPPHAFRKLFRLLRELEAASGEEAES